MTGRTPATRTRKTARHSEGAPKETDNQVQALAAPSGASQAPNPSAMPSTRDCRQQTNEHSGESQHRSHPSVPCPPEEEPTLRQILFMLVQQNANAQNRSGTPSKLMELQRTSPPVFTQSDDPLDADDWLRTMEQKLEVIKCPEQDKVPFAAQYLQGPAAAWWENYRSVRNKETEITWEEFAGSFRKHHIPSGLIGIKKKEFWSLKQGTMTVTEYLRRFTQLSRYASGDLPNEQAKVERFMSGLQQVLQCQLSTHEFPDLATLVNKAVILEDQRKALGEVRKRKIQRVSAEQPRQKPRFGQHQTPRFFPR